MKLRSPGFTMLLVLMLVAAISVASIAFMQSNTFLVSLAFARESQEHQYWAHYGLQNYARSLVAQKADLPKHPIVVPWPDEQSGYLGIITFTQTTSEITALVQLTKQNQILKESTMQLQINPANA